LRPIAAKSLLNRQSDSRAKVAGILLFALAVYVLGAAVRSLLDRQGAEFSLPGLLLTIFTIPLMYLLFRRKSDLARSLTAALRADAAETSSVLIYHSSLSSVSFASL
jgi:divalent metal cation (Fe/Co/Zn/Cd) transporter